MKTLRIYADFVYDDDLIHGDDPEAIKWFKEQLLGDDVSLFIGDDLGDFVGDLKVLHFKEIN